MKASSDDGGTAAAVYYCANSVNQYTATDGDTPGCPSPTETFGHDADGNLEYDGTFTYEWDGENRLKAVYKTTPTSTSDRKLVFDYDYMSRRVRKQAFAWTGTAWATSAASDQRFVYDEWNVIMVLDGLSTNAITRKYSWGLDLSGTFHGAGGIGGLLACEEPGAEDTHRYWFMYDANGNVGQVIDATSFLTLGIAARYEYDAYGNALVASGTYAAANPFRFSTKWLDAETGLYYYGYRYYSPLVGQWLSRDPLQEQGAANLYVLVGNDPVGRLDYLGLRDCDAEHVQCFRGCWNSNPPWPVRKGKWDHYAYCESKCVAEYLACLAAEGVQATFECMAAAAAWLRDHPEVVVGTVVVVGGVVYVVATGGTGALILVPAAL